MFDSISSLDTSRTSWKIKVRVTRMWPSASSASDSKDGLKGYNLILLDDDNYHVHAFVYADNWKTIGKDIVEGGVYIITNFYTKEATGTLRPTNSKIIINFSNSTTVEKLPEDDFMIPNHKFELVDLGELFGLASSYENENSPAFSTDIIGPMEDFEDVKSIKTMYGDRKISKFRITDGRYSHKVTVWGYLAVKTDELYKQIKDRPIIVIVTSSKLKVFKSSVQINTLPSSKIYLDLDDEVVTAMRSRLEEEGYKVADNNYLGSPIPTPAIPVIETLTLRELSEKTNAGDEKLKFLCCVKISNVEQAEKWWYYCCPDCYGDLARYEGRYKCSSCPKLIPVAEKRYKIIVLAADKDEAFNFILLDKASKRIIGQTATKLLSDNMKLEETGEYPALIKQIIGKEFTFQIEISSDNVVQKSKIFRVTDAYDSEFSTSSPSTSTMAGFTLSSSSENIIDLSNCTDTPGSPQSISKKPKTEKI